MYIKGNHKVYPNDFDKINFVLSFMNSREAAAWNEQFIEEQPNLENLDLESGMTSRKILKKCSHPTTRLERQEKNSKDYRKKGKLP